MMIICTCVQANQVILIAPLGFEAAGGGAAAAAVPVDAASTDPCTEALASMSWQASESQPYIRLHVN